MTPRYPVFVPSRGRVDCCLTARALTKDGVPYTLVVEPREADAYRAAYPSATVAVLPENDRGLVYARNAIKDMARATDATRHWQLDDNISRAGRLLDGRRYRCPFGVALSVVEDFVDRYTNIAIAGLNYWFFVIPTTMGPAIPPFYLNDRVYSCTLVDHTRPYRWRAALNDDTDMCLQVLSDGLCTVLVNAVVVCKARTMTLPGGNHPIYRGDGRALMARSIVRDWPRVARMTRRFDRPQHVVPWRKFDTPLIRRADVDVAALAAQPNDYGLTLAAP